MNETSADDLSSKSFSIELFTAEHIVKKIGWEHCKANENTTNDFFVKPNKSNFSTWRSSVRNGYFHIHPV